MSREIDEAIETHIEMLIDEDVLARIGADKQPQRELSQRVMRIFEDYNRLLTLEAAKAESEKRPSNDCIGCHEPMEHYYCPRCKRLWES